MNNITNLPLLFTFTLSTILAVSIAPVCSQESLRLPREAVDKLVPNGNAYSLRVIKQSVKDNVSGDMLIDPETGIFSSVTFFESAPKEPKSVLGSVGYLCHLSEAAATDVTKASLVTATTSHCGRFHSQLPVRFSSSLSSVLNRHATLKHEQRSEQRVQWALWLQNLNGYLQEKWQNYARTSKFSGQANLHVIVNPGAQIQEITPRFESADSPSENTVKSAEKFVADFNGNPLLEFPEGSRVSKVHLLVNLQKQSNLNSKIRPPSS